MKRTTKAFFTGLGLGAALMYTFDPFLGRRRRSYMQEKLTFFARRSERTINGIARDVSNRMYGVYAATRRLTGKPLPHQERRRNLRAA